MNITAIKQYGLGSLFKIAIFKVLYKLKLKSYKSQAPFSWNSKEGQIDATLSFDTFFRLCDTQVDTIVTEANSILEGNITLFGESFSFDPTHGWLNDPVTGGQQVKRLLCCQVESKTVHHNLTLYDCRHQCLDVA